MTNDPTEKNTFGDDQSSCSQEDAPAGAATGDDCAPGNADAPRTHPVFRLHGSKPGHAADAGQCASAQSILYEVEECATRFAETGKEALIDLRCLKAMPEERGILGILLGLGEVTAIVEAPCNAEVHQTSIPCVWLVRHRNDDEEIVGERIEIAEVPDVISGDRNAVMPKLEAMRSARQFFM